MSIKPQSHDPKGNVNVLPLFSSNTVHLMKFRVIWKFCQYFYSLVINKLLMLWRAVLIMWTKVISKLLSDPQKEKKIKILIILYEVISLKSTVDEIKSSSKGCW